MPPSLIRLSCTGCAGDFDFEALEPVAVCPYCRHEQRLPDEVLGQVQAYETAAKDEANRADLQQLIAARYQALAPAAWTGVLLWLGLSVPVIGGIAAMFLGGGVLSLSAVGILGAVFAVSAVLSLVRHRAEHAGLATTRFSCACPGCGAQTSMEVGQTFARCEYCQAALVPGERVAALGVGLARARTLAARRNAVAASRRFRVTADQRNRVFGVLAAAITPVLPGVITIYSYQQYEAGQGELGQVAFAAAATGLLVIAPLALGAFRRLRSARIRAAISALTARPGCVELDGVTGTVAWLSDLWPDEYGEYYDLQPGRGYRAAALSVRGFSVLVAVDPARFAHIAVAATVDSRPSCKPLNAAGFQVSRCASGVLASLRGKPLAALIADPSHKLPEAVDALVGCVGAAGGRPAARI